MPVHMVHPYVTQVEGVLEGEAGDQWHPDPGA